MSLPVALSIGGSDPSGGAGIQADLKTFHQFGVYGEAVITCITVQNSRRVSRVEVLSQELVREQMEAVLSDIPPAAMKTGALGNERVIEAVVAGTAGYSIPLIVDPVMISKHGARLISPEAEEALRTNLLPATFLLTPNIPEAEVLTGRPIRNEEEMVEAAQSLRSMGCRAVLVKGGHLSGEPVDVLSTGDVTLRFPGRRVATPHTHGTGCTYSAAITAGLAQGRTLTEAVGWAKHYVQGAIESAPGLGGGHGPLNHFAPVEPPPPDSQTRAVSGPE